MAAERILPPPFFEERLANRFVPKVAFQEQPSFRLAHAIE
jgi:hypothetical protein